MVSEKPHKYWFIWVAGDAKKAAEAAL